MKLKLLCGLQRNDPSENVGIVGIKRRARCSEDQRRIAAEQILRRQRHHGAIQPAGARELAEVKTQIQIESGPGGDLRVGATRPLPLVPRAVARRPPNVSAWRVKVSATLAFSPGFQSNAARAFGATGTPRESIPKGAETLVQPRMFPVASPQWLKRQGAPRSVRLLANSPRGLSPISCCAEVFPT